MEIMKLFKKALVATAIFGAMGAQAADLTDAVKSTSKQGLEVAAAAPESSVRVIVRQQLEAGDQITLVFGKGVTGITAVATDGAGDAQGTSANNELGLVYGSGTYKLTPASVSTTDGVTTVVLTVKTGDPVTKDSSFEVQVRGANFDKTKATEATVTYSAKSGLDGSAKDTTGDNSGSFIILKDQYSAVVKSKANGIIQRDNLKVFKSGYAGTDVDTDSIILTITDTQTLLSAANDTLVQATVTVEGDFSSTAFDTIANFAVAGGTNTTVGTPVRATDKKSVSFTLTDTATANGIAGDYTITLNNATQDIKATDFKATVVVDASTASTTNTKQEVITKADAGKWELDATIINVPYFPVGFEGVSSSVHFANETSSATDVIITAIGTDGTTYSSGNQADFLAKQQVTKVSQGTIMSLLKDSKGNSVPAGTKLSVTFNIDANDGEVNAYAFSSTSTGRQSLVTSQQKGK